MSLSLGIGLGMSTQDFAPFDPINLFGNGEEGAWYDPSDLTTLFQDTAGLVPVTTNLDSVRRVEDKSGNGNHVISPTGGTSPTYRTSGGLHWLEFDGVTEYLYTSGIDLTSSGDVTVFSGMDADAVTGMAYELSAAAGTGNPGSFHLFLSTSEYQIRSAGTVQATAITTNSPAGSADVLTMQSGISTDTLKLRQNGTEILTTSSDQGTGNFGNYPFYIGMRAGATFPLAGKMYGLVLRAAQSSAADISQTESYIAGKSGVTL